MKKMARMKKTMKSSISLILSIIIGISAIPMNIYADDNQTTTETTTEPTSSVASGICGDNLNWEITADYRLIISGSGAMYDYWNKDVDKELKLAPWAEYAPSILEIVIGENVTKIGKFAFHNFTGITEVTIPDNVTYIGQQAFSNAAALTEMTLPFIGQGEGAKYDQTSLLGRIFSATEYEGGVKCTQTSSSTNYYYTAYLPAGLKKITVTGAEIFSGAFSGCVTLEEIILNGDITKINPRTFQNCKNLKDFTIPKSVTSIDTYAFAGCESLTSFTILSDFTCKNTSFDNKYVESVYISCDVIDAYYDSTTSQWIKSDFKSWMGTSSFVSCYKIHTDVNDNICVKCNADVQKEEEDAYLQLESYYQAVSAEVGKNTLLPDKFAFKFTAEYDDLYTFDISDESFITQLVLDGNKVTKQKRELPYSVRMKKGETILAIVEYCEEEKLNLSLTALLGSDYGDLIAFGKVNDKIKWILEESGTLILEGTGAVPDYNAEPVYPVTSPNVYYQDAPPWMRYAKHIKHLKVKEGITKLGKDNFCDGGYKMYYPEPGSGGEWLGSADAVLHNINMALESIELASSVVEIGDYSFGGSFSKRLKEFEVLGTVKKIGEYAFSGNDALITFQKGVEWIGKSAFWSTHINQSKLPDSITYIGENAFSNCEFSQGLLILPNSLEKISKGAFSGCENLKKVVLPEGLKIIEDSAFSVCRDLEEVNMPESLEEIGSYSFYKTNLQSLRFGNNIKKIGCGAFLHCRYSYVKVPAIEDLGEPNFAGRTQFHDDYDAEKDLKGLDTIVVSEGVKTIDILGEYRGRLVLPKSITYLNYDYVGGPTHPNNICIGGSPLSKYYQKKCYIYRDTYVDELFNDISFMFAPGDIEYIVTAGDCGYNTYFVLTENNELVLLGEGEMYDYEKVEDVPWYEYAEQIENIEISRDITSIGDKAFENCKNLKSIYYPTMKGEVLTKAYMNVDNLQKIGKDSFKGCDNFVLQCHADSVTNKYIFTKKIDVVVKTVENQCGEQCYWNIDSEGTLTISGSGNMEDYSAKKAPWYSYRSSVKKVVLGEEILGIGEYAFSGCYNLLSVEGMESIQSVGSHAFDGCTKLEIFELGENCEVFSVTSVLNCSKIKTLYLPSSIIDITDLEEYSEKVPFLIIEDGFELEELLIEYEVRYGRVGDSIIDNIVLSHSDIILDKNTNQSIIVTASCDGQEIDTEKILWSSSDQSVAKVQNGVIIAVGEGVAEIKCYSKEDETIYATCKVEVHSIDEVKVEPTCEENGCIKHQCMVCNKVISIENEIEATGHTYNCEIIGEKYMKSPNVYYKSCGVCGAIEAETFEISGSHGKISVSSEKGYVGRTVTISISIDENPGFVNMMLNVKYDTNSLKLVQVNDSGVLGGAMHNNNLGGYPYLLCWANDTAMENLTAEGTVVTMSFEVLQDANLGQSPIEVFYNYANSEVIDYDLNAIGFEISNGSVDIRQLLVGDVNCDGLVNTLDRTVLARYLANWDEYTADTIDLIAADVNGDGVVNTLDRLVLARYLANWEGYETLPCDI